MSNAIKPDHYRKDRQYQPWDVAKDWDLDFDLGSVTKYIGRCGNGKIFVLMERVCILFIKQRFV